MIGPPAESAYAVDPRGVAAIKPSHLKAKSSSPPTRTSTEISWCGRFLMSTASFAARRATSLATWTSSIRYCCTSSPPPKTFSTPASTSSGSIPDIKPTFPSFTPSSTWRGNILVALSIVPPPPRTKTRSGSVFPSGSPAGLTSEISTPRFSSAATSRSRYPSLTPGFATMPTQRTSRGSMRSATPDDLRDPGFVQRRPRSTHEVKRVLPVASPPSRDRRPRETYRAEPQRLEGARDVPDHRRVNPWIAHQTAAADQLWSRLELGLDEHDRLAQRRRGGKEAPEGHSQGDEGEVGDEEVGEERQVLAGQVSHVGALLDDNPRVVPQRPVQLPVAHVDGQDPPGAPPQERVGETAGRGAGVDAGSAFYPHPEHFDSSVELLSGARDEAVLTLDGERFVRGDAQAGLRDHSVADAHGAREDQTLRSAPRLGEAALDEQGVQPLRFVSQVSSPGCARSRRGPAARRCRRPACREPRGLSRRPYPPPDGLLRGRRRRRRSPCPARRRCPRSCQVCGGSRWRSARRLLSGSTIPAPRRTRRRLPARPLRRRPGSRLCARMT